MKIGDKIVCKMGFDDIEKGDIVTVRDFTMLNNIACYCEKRRMSFVMSNKPPRWYIWSYFYTEQELRKIKLKKLI